MAKTLWPLSGRVSNTPLRLLIDLANIMQPDYENLYRWLLTWAGLMLGAALLGLGLTLTKIALGFFGIDIGL
jgi:hypothetical protein